MHLTSFIHREKLFNIAERWFCGRLEPGDPLSLTQILICDGFVIGETIGVLARHLLEVIHGKPCRQMRIHFKGGLRDVLCRHADEEGARVRELCRSYREHPDFYYREAPINGFVCLDEEDKLLAFYRVKRPKRIAEKANRKIANWIFENVQKRAKQMAEERARKSGIPIEWFVTPPEEMLREFIDAEQSIARSFKEGTIQFDKTALTINDVGAIKIIADTPKLAYLESVLASDPKIRIIDREIFRGHYQGTNLILEVQWDAEQVCSKYRDSGRWEKYRNRGVPDNELKKGLEPLLVDAAPKVNVELILATFPDMVESELGNSIHEERIIDQRDNKIYKGYIPINVEFLLEYLFAVGFSPQTQIDFVPIKLWGRYLPETLSSHIRHLYHLPEDDMLY